MWTWNQQAFLGGRVFHGNHVTSGGGFLCYFHNRPAGVFVDPKPDGPHGVGWPGAFMVGWTNLNLLGWLVGWLVNFWSRIFWPISHFGSMGLVFSLPVHFCYRTSKWRMTSLLSRNLILSLGSRGVSEIYLYSCTEIETLLQNLSSISV